MDKPKSLNKKIISVCVLLVLLLVLIYSGLRIAESTFLYPQGTSPSSQSKTITVDGVEYFPKQDITVLMVLGIDKYGQVESSGYFRNDGNCDVVMLLILDDTQRTCDVLVLNRDTMLEMPVTGIDGTQAGTAYAQLALAHTYGEGLEDSCENVKTAVSQFLCGINIDYYLSMNMDAISILNDAVGGVTVTVTDDFSGIDDTIPIGTVTLQGQQAVSYIRTRKGLGDQLNLSRLERHKAYMTGFVAALRQTEDADLMLAYDEVSPYVVTDCSSNTLSGFMNRFADYEFGQIYTLNGENVLGDQYYEFYADEDVLQELVLKLFYAEKT